MEGPNGIGLSPDGARCTCPSRPLLLDQQLTDEERMVRDSESRYAQERLQPRILEAFRNETADPSIFREMGGLGLLGTSFPAEYDGAGFNYVC